MNQSDSTCATRQEFQVSLPRDKLQMLTRRIDALEAEVPTNFLQRRGGASLFHTCPNKIKHVTLLRREFFELVHSRFSILYLFTVCKRRPTRHRGPGWCVDALHSQRPQGLPDRHARIQHHGMETGAARQRHWTGAATVREEPSPRAGRVLIGMCIRCRSAR